MFSLTNTPADIALFGDLDACSSAYMQQKTMQKTIPTMPGLHLSMTAQQHTTFPGDAEMCCMLCLHLWRLSRASAILCCFRCEPQLGQSGLCIVHVQLSAAVKLLSCGRRRSQSTAP